MTEQTNITEGRIALVEKRMDQIETVLSKRLDAMETNWAKATKDLLEAVSSEFKKAGEGIVYEIQAMRKDLIPPATGKGKIDAEFVFPIIRTLCWMVFAVVTWFTGVNPVLHRLGYLGDYQVVKEALK